jgi:hypothetical protein
MFTSLTISSKKKQVFQGYLFGIWQQYMIINTSYFFNCSRPKQYWRFAVLLKPLIQFNKYPWNTCFYTITISYCKHVFKIRRLDVFILSEKYCLIINCLMDDLDNPCAIYFLFLFHISLSGTGILHILYLWRCILCWTFLIVFTVMLILCCN